MTRNPRGLQPGPLGVGLAALPLSFILCLGTSPAAGAAPPMDPAMDLIPAVASGVALVVCGLAWWLLIQEVERGYPPSRSSLAAVVLLGASAWPLLVFSTAIRRLLMA